jgi:hypothetical protein
MCVDCRAINNSIWAKITENRTEITRTETELTETEKFDSKFGSRFQITEISQVNSVPGLG